MENIKHDYLNSVCTRIIKMLSPPSNENVVATILQKTSPIMKLAGSRILSLRVRRRSS